MNANSPKPGTASFWRRLARFIRHPTTDWAQTEFAPEERSNPAKDAARQRQAQRLDRAAVLIRDREFDALRREMRNRKARTAQPLEGLNLPSTLPPPLRAATRQHTLHKINAIERQIQDEHKRQLSTTLPAGMIVHSGLAQVDFAASTLRPGSDRRNTPRLAGGAHHAPAAPRSTQPPYRPSQPPPQPAWADSAQPPPAVVELAAFDFAEGRDAQVEAHLLTALQTETIAAVRQQVFQALLDFYWASGQNDKLQARALEYVRDYGQTPAPRPELGTLADGARTAQFFAAEVFDVLQLHAFERFVCAPAGRLLLDWSALVSIDAAQRGALARALRTLNDRAVELELHGADMLLAATRLHDAATPSDEAALRLQVLRLVGDEAAFVDLAVELAVACACSPEDWIPPRWTRISAQQTGLTTLHGTQPMSRTATSAGAADAGLVQTTVRLSGVLGGSGNAFLPTLRAQALRADIITVDLQAVQRVDFAAATDLLNWVEAQTQLGKLVELRGAHTLLVPFLRSVGLEPRR